MDVVLVDMQPCMDALITTSDGNQFVGQQKVIFYTPRRDIDPQLCDNIENKGCTEFSMMPISNFTFYFEYKSVKLVVCVYLFKNGMIPANLKLSIIRASSSEKGKKNRKIGIQSPKK